jgi:subtilisin family serine protease
MCPDDTFYYSDFVGSGTFDAGVACGTGRWNSSYQGVAPGAYYLAVKVFDPLGITYWSFVISGIQWAISHGADIILFCGSIPGLYLDPMSLAFDAACDEGVFCVTPAGDDGPSYMSIDSPGQALEPICVGAYNSSSGQVQALISERGLT